MYRTHTVEEIFQWLLHENMSQQQPRSRLQYIKAREGIKELPLEQCVHFTSDDSPDWNGQTPLSAYRISLFPKHIYNYAFLKLDNKECQ